MSATVTILGARSVSVDGQLVRTTHDLSKDLGAFANPAGKPERINAAHPAPRPATGTPTSDTKHQRFW